MAEASQRREGSKSSCYSDDWSREEQKLEEVWVSPPQKLFVPVGAGTHYGVPP